MKVDIVLELKVVEDILIDRLLKRAVSEGRWTTIGRRFTKNASLQYADSTIGRVLRQAGEACSG